MGEIYGDYTWPVAPYLKASFLCCFSMIRIQSIISSSHNRRYEFHLDNTIWQECVDNPINISKHRESKRVLNLAVQDRQGIHVDHTVTN